MTNEEEKVSPHLTFGIVYPMAAGLDVGSTKMFVSYPDATHAQMVREYSAFTDDLIRLARDLTTAGVTHIAMEATGVYWMSVFEILEQYGLKVTLINAQAYKNVAGQKTDVKDCQWIQQLHAHGLLRSSHIAEEQYRELRTFIHERSTLKTQKSDTLNRIHKVLTQMNIKLQHVISDIEGVAGMQIIRRIAAGVTNVESLLSGIKTKNLKCSVDDLTRSLNGIFKPHFLVVLNRLLSAYDFFKAEMLAYEQMIEQTLKKMVPPEIAHYEIHQKKVKSRKNQYHFNLKEYLTRIVGTDLTQIDGLDEASILTIISVVGLDMDKWPTADHFTSWLNLAARPRISGGKVLGHQKRYTKNAATLAFRLAAQSMWQHKGPLGNLYRRLCRTKGSAKANKAVARRLAIIFYCMVKNKSEYNPQIVVMNDEKIRARGIARLQKEAEKLGCRIEYAF